MTGATEGSHPTGHDPDRIKCVVWDLDGTLADDRARAHFVEVEAGRQRDWSSYFDAIEADPPIAASMELLQALRASGIRILFLTGRPEFLDIAIVYGLLNVIGTIAVLKFFRYGDLGEAGAEDEDETAH